MVANQHVPLSSDWFEDSIQKLNNDNLPDFDPSDLFDRMAKYEEQSLAEAAEPAVSVSSKGLVFTISAAYWLRSNRFSPHSEQAAFCILLGGEQGGLYDAQSISEHMNEMKFGDQDELINFLACWRDWVRS
jgi:hypothetical protein